jgi:hypothetical protein
MSGSDRPSGVEHKRYTYFSSESINIQKAAAAEKGVDNLRPCFLCVSAAGQHPNLDSFNTMLEGYIREQLSGSKDW